MRVQVSLETQSDVIDFVKIAENISENITLTDNNGLRVSAKSLLGVMYSLEFDEIWCECSIDVYQKIKQYIIE